MDNIIKSFEYNTYTPTDAAGKVYGHTELAAWSNVLDMVHVPYNDTTYVMTRESNYGSTGGLAKSVVLYAVTSGGKRQEIDRRVITDQFDRRNDQLKNWELNKIEVSISRVWEDRNMSASSGGVYRREVRDQYFAVYLVTDKDPSGCFLDASYYRKRFDSVNSRSGYYGRDAYIYEDKKELKLQVEPSLFTSERIAAFFKEFEMSLPDINPTQTLV